MRLSNDAIDNWNHFYDKLVQFRKAYGHINIPSDNDEYDELLEWIKIQKRARHKLPKQFIDKLNAIGFSFSTDQINDWYDRFNELEQFFVKYGHANVPSTERRYESLHKWLMAQIRNKQRLDDKQIEKLDSLSVYWDIKTHREWRWHEMYLQLRDFHKNHGHCNVPQKYEANPKLGNWVAVQRRSFANGKIKKDRKSRLDALGFVWDYREVFANQWEEKYQQLIAFKKDFGHCKVPVTYPNQPLAGWVDRQRTLKTKGQLPKDREKKLNKIGFIWDCTVLQEESWEKRYKELKAYQKRFGDCKVPANWKENRSLGIWVRTQRRLEKLRKLDPNKKKKLDQLGFVWGKDAWQLQLKEYDQLWEKNYQKLKAYKKKHGSVQVSLDIDSSLERWTCIQRKNKKTGKLSDDKIKKLEKIGFAWDLHESYWMSMYHLLVQFKKEFGHTRVPWRWEKNPQLGQWVSRTRLKQYEMTKSQISLLNKIDFDWHVIRKKPESWSKMFSRLSEFKSKYGHTRVPVNWQKDKKLGKWVSRLRSDQEKLKQERKILLNGIGFEWKKRRGRPKKDNKDFLVEASY